MDLNTRVLTLTSYDEQDGQVLRVTVAPHLVECVIANSLDVVKFGMKLKKTSIMFMDGGVVELYLTDLDLTTLEFAVGAYVLP